jgi:hypothetical protein
VKCLSVTVVVLVVAGIHDLFSRTFGIVACNEMIVNLIFF